MWFMLVRFTCCVWFIIRHCVCVCCCVWLSSFPHVTFLRLRIHYTSLTDGVTFVSSGSDTSRPIGWPRLAPCGPSPWPLPEVSTMTGTWLTPCIVGRDVSATHSPARKEREDSLLFKADVAQDGLGGCACETIRHRRLSKCFWMHAVVEFLFEDRSFSHDHRKLQTWKSESPRRRNQRHQYLLYFRGNVYTSTVQGATVVSLCTLWTLLNCFHYALTECESWECDTNLSSTPPGKHSWDQDLCLSKGTTRLCELFPVQMLSFSLGVKTWCRRN